MVCIDKTEMSIEIDYFVIYGVIIENSLFMVNEGIKEVELLMFLQI